MVTMAGYSLVLQRMVQARIGAPAPLVTRQAPPTAPMGPAAKIESGAGERDIGVRADKIAAMLCWYTSKDCRRRHRVLMTAVAAMANLSRQTIYLARRGIMSERTCLLLSRAISAIERGEVTWRRRRQQWETEYHSIRPATPPRNLDSDPDDPATVLQKINDYGRPPKTVAVDLGAIVVNVVTCW
jgi:hypothetical protein